MKTLLLNLDMTPLKVIDWPKCIILQMKKAIQPIEYHERTIRDSANRQWPVAKVALIKKYVRPPKHVVLSKKNVFTRDDFQCVYCGSHSNLTIDHVIPTSKGGKHIWTNVVTACGKCNRKKGNRLLENPVHPREPNPVGFGLDLSEWPQYASKKNEENKAGNSARTQSSDNSTQRGSTSSHRGYSK